MTRMNRALRRYHEHLSALRAGNYSVVEGVVESFHPMPYEGHSYESFRVRGIRFTYSDYTITPCFNNTASHGGPIREGIRVRVVYRDNGGSPSKRLGKWPRNSSDSLRGFLLERA